MKIKSSESLSKLTARAQKVFNAYIRKRDQYKGCISCGGPVEHAGHYFSAGHYTALRFNEMNVNGQCNHCNRFLHGNLIKYRQGLVYRYGEAKVQWLEACADLRKVKRYSYFELDLLVKEYTNKLKEVYVRAC